MFGKVFGSIVGGGVVSAAEGVANIIDQFVETDDEKHAAEIIKYELTDGLKLRKLIGACDDWQLYGDGHGSRALICSPELRGRWVETGLMDEPSLAEGSFEP